VPPGAGGLAAGVGDGRGEDVPDTGVGAPTVQGGEGRVERVGLAGGEVLHVGDAEAQQVRRDRRADVRDHLQGAGRAPLLGGEAGG